MCTVSFIPIHNGFVLTSSRDERTNRGTTIPQWYTIDGLSLIFPKDNESGGSWIAYGGKNRICCLLNGGFENHIKRTRYLKSRGLVLLDSFQFDSIPKFIQYYDLNFIEPFTMLLLDYNQGLKFTKLVWNGNNKYVEVINSDKPHLFSSTTLYSTEIIKEREIWFQNWIAKYREEEDVNISQFHLGHHTPDSTNNILMDRSELLKTVSLTQIKIGGDYKTMIYFDLKTGFEEKIKLS